MKYGYKRLGNAGSCWHCGCKTTYSCVELDGSDYFCCEICLGKLKRIRKFRRKLINYTPELKQAEILDNSFVENEKTNVLSQGAGND